MDGQDNTMLFNFYKCKAYEYKLLAQRQTGVVLIKLLKWPNRNFGLATFRSSARPTQGFKFKAKTKYR